jgi:DNA-binding NarL/FixJ family response regulator
MVSIVLIENQTLVREGLRALIEKEEGFSVVGEGSNGQDAIRLVQELKPSVLLLELLLPELHGLEVLRQLKTDEGTRAVVLSSHSNASYVIEVLKVGAAGYILKDNSSMELFQAIRAAASGDHFISKELRSCALELTIGRHGRNGRNGDEHLTTRERVVLELAAEGFTNAEIATRLTISRRTVESHRASLMLKLGLRSQTELVRYAIRNHLINA